MKVLVLFFLISCLFFSCTKNDEVAPVTGASVAIESLNVAYGPDPLQQMDIYLPPNRTVANTKVLIMIHGGGWFAGDKADFNEFYDSLKARLPAFAIFNINYRLVDPATSANIWPTQNNDITAVLDFIKSKAAYYVINASKIAILGGSAGGHLALYEAYHNNSSGNIKAVVDLFGPAEVKDFYSVQDSLYQHYMDIFLTGTPTTNPTAYHNVSPLYYVNKSSPPTIIFHGTADTVVPIRESDSLFRRLSSYSSIHKIYRYSGASHGWIGANLIDTYNKSAAFILANVK